MASDAWTLTMELKADCEFDTLEVGCLQSRRGSNELLLGAGGDGGGPDHALLVPGIPAAGSTREG